MAQDNGTNKADAEEGTDEKNPRKRLWLWLAAAGVLLIAASIGGTLTVLHLTKPTPEPTVADPATPARQPAIYYPLKPSIIVNYSVRGRQRFLQVDLTLLLRDGSTVSAIELHQPMLRNALVLLFSGQDYEQLQTAEGKELLRQAALQELQRLLQQEIGRPGIEQVLFTNFVMQ